MRADRLIDQTQVRERLGDGAEGCQIEMVPHGPALVRGASTVADDHGQPHRANRPVVAVCACGLTQRGPWCDATHKVAASAP